MLADTIKQNKFLKVVVEDGKSGEGLSQGQLKVPDITVTITNPHPHPSSLEIELLGPRKDQPTISFGIDVSITDPHSIRNYPHFSEKKVKKNQSAKYLEDAEARKRSTYTHFTNETGLVVLPFVLSSSTEFGSTAIKILRFLESLNPQSQLHNEAELSPSKLSSKQFFKRPLNMNTQHIIQQCSIINEKFRSEMKNDYEDEVRRLLFLAQPPPNSYSLFSTSNIISSLHDPLTTADPSGQPPPPKKPPDPQYWWKTRIRRKGMTSTTWSSKEALITPFQTEIISTTESEREAEAVKDALWTQLPRKIPSRHALLNSRRTRDALPQSACSSDTPNVSSSTSSTSSSSPSSLKTMSFPSCVLSIRREKTNPNSPSLQNATTTAETSSSSSSSSSGTKIAPFPYTHAADAWKRRREAFCRIAHRNTRHNINNSHRDRTPSPPPMLPQDYSSHTFAQINNNSSSGSRMSTEDDEESEQQLRNSTQQ